MDTSADQTPTADGPLFRKPKQERSLARYNLLLDAAHRLLETHEPQDLGLYQVAKEAGVPAASAYHFFPSPAAIAMALAERYQRQINVQVAGAVAPPDGMWQSLLREHMSRLVAVYNSNLPMMKIMVGPHTSREQVASDALFVEGMARILVQVSAQFFHMPVIKDAERRFLVLLTLIHALWGLSFSKHGRITEEFAAETAIAAIAYCRTFLPEFLDLRQPQT